MPMVNNHRYHNSPAACPMREDAERFEMSKLAAPELRLAETCAKLNNNALDYYR